MEDLIKKIKLLKNIVPDDGFAFSAKSSILASEAPPKKFSYLNFTNPKFWASSIAMTALILIVVVINNININPPSVTESISEIAALDLTAAAFESDIEITLREIRAYEESAKKTAVALSEASLKDHSHINSFILEEEFNALDITVPSPEEIEEANRLLEQIIF